MSDAQQESRAETLRDDLRENLGRTAKHWANTRLGHEGLMLDRIQRQGRIVEQLAKNTMTGDTQDVSGWPGSEGDDAMGVNIGDHIHYHAAADQPQPTTPPAAATPPAPVAATPTEQPAAWKTWLKTLGPPLAAAALGAGGVAGYQWMTGPDEKPPAVTTPGEVQPYEYPSIIGPGVSTDRLDHLPGE